MANVTFKWSDWETSTESFKREEQVFPYISAIQEDKGIECISFKSDNTKWLF